jgi:hypothetical protein
MTPLAKKRRHRPPKAPSIYPTWQTTGTLPVSSSPVKRPGKQKRKSAQVDGNEETPGDEEDNEKGQGYDDEKGLDGEDGLWDEEAGGMGVEDGMAEGDRNGDRDGMGDMGDMTAHEYFSKRATQGWETRRSHKRVQTMRSELAFLSDTTSSRTSLPCSVPSVLILLSRIRGPPPKQCTSLFSRHSLTRVSVNWPYEVIGYNQTSANLAGHASSATLPRLAILHLAFSHLCPYQTNTLRTLALQETGPARSAV